MTLTGDALGMRRSTKLGILPLQVLRIGMAAQACSCSDIHLFTNPRHDVYCLNNTHAGDRLGDGWNDPWLVDDDNERGIEI